jgi:hypothetical protein
VTGLSFLIETRGIAMKRIFWTAGEYRFDTKLEARTFAKERRIDAICKRKMTATDREIRDEPKLGCKDWVRLDRCEQLAVYDT